MALIKELQDQKERVLKNFDSKQTRVQKKKSFLFPDLQETTYETVILEFMKIWLLNLSIKCESKSEHK